MTCAFATVSVDRDSKLLVLNILSWDLKEPTHLSIRVGVVDCHLLYYKGPAVIGEPVTVFLTRQGKS